MIKIINDEAFCDQEGNIHHEEGVEILSGNIELSGLEISLIGVISRETILRQYVEQVRKNYDYIIIDCMPSLGMLTINALACAFENEQGYLMKKSAWSRYCTVEKGI